MLTKCIYCGIVIPKSHSYLTESKNDQCKKCFNEGKENEKM